MFCYQVWWKSAESYQLSAVPAVTVLSNNPQCFVNVSSSLPLELYGILLMATKRGWVVMEDAPTNQTLRHPVSLPRLCLFGKKKLILKSQLLNQSVGGAAA